MFNKKYICLLLLFIIGLVAISQVSAAQDYMNDTVGMGENGEVLEKNMNHDILAAENENNALAPNRTFKDLNDVINGNDDLVINLTQDYKFDSNIDMDFKKGIVINRALTINGNGHIIDAGGSARIFNVTNVNDVLFKNISFVKGSGQGNAGAVIGGTSINCNFTDCLSISGDGGAAIYKGTAVNCIFSRNLVLIGQGGAAMYMGYAINCTFIENNAPSGGAMYGGTAVNCIFRGNKARNGGAIYETVARSCNFISNSASSGSGGAASNSDCYNCNFEDNSANAGGAGYGGNYYNSIFKSNQVMGGSSGGALFEPHLAFNCTFIDNEAEEGSAIYGGTASYCTFKSNDIAGTEYYIGPSIEANNSSGISGVGEVFEFKTMVGTVEVFDLDVTLTVYDLDEGGEVFIKNVPLKSGQSWIIDLNPGLYKVKLALDDFSSVAPIEVSLNTLKIPTTISFNATHIITNPIDTTYLLATLKDYNNETLSGYAIFSEYNGGFYDTDENGQTIIPIEDLPAGRHTLLFKFNGAGRLNESSATVTVDVNKLPTEITSPQKSYGFWYDKTENCINITLMDNLGRFVSDVNLTVYLNGTTENYTTDENGTIKIPVSAFIPGNYSLNVTFDGNDDYLKSNNTYFFEVFKIETVLSGNFIREYNAPGNLIVSLEYMDYNKHVFVPLVHTEVFVEFNGNNFTYVTVGGGTIGIPTGGLAVGNYTAKIIFKGNEFYENATLITNVTINKGISQFIFTRPYFYPHYGNGEEFKVQLQDSYGNPVVGNQTITVELNGLRNYYTDEDGAAFISSNDAPIGYHRARITFVGNENYTNATRFLDVTVDKGNTQLSLDYQAVAFDSGEDLVFTLKDGMGRPINGVNLTVEFNGIKEYTTDENGKIYVPTDGLAAGSYAANITFEGNGNYVEATNLNVNFNISKATANIVVNPMSLIYSEQGWLNITLSYNNRPIKGNLLNVSLNSMIYGYIFDRNYTTDENGTVRILLEDLPAGEYLVSIIYGGNENFKEITRYTFVKVEKGFSVLSAGNLVTTYNSDEKFIFMLRDGFGRPVGGSNVTVYLNGVVKMFTTDENGQIYVSNNGLAAGSYAANITFEGNINYTKARKLSVNVTINKVTPHIIFENSDINTVYGVDYLINITFKDDHHVPIRGYNVLSVEFKSPSKSYSAKEYITDENGKLTISTKDLAAEYYLMDVTFQGNENFTEETNYKRVIIKKDDTKLYSDNLITSYNSGEKLLVNLTDSFGKSIEGVSITVILYGAAEYTTDENGTIEVSTDDLNPGDYLTLISFDGNENYTQSNLIASISIIKDNTTLDISKEIIDNDVNITAYVHPNATGLVKFEIKGPEQYIIYSDIVGGNAVSHHILTEGDYLVNVTYIGDIHFNSNSTSQNFTVKGHIKKNTTIISNVKVENYTVTITSAVDSNATGFVTIGILGQTFIVPVSGGKAVFTYDFVPGTYVADVVYLGDDNFNNANATVSFTVTEQIVELKNTAVSVNVVSVENDVTITANVDILASGLVEFNIGGKSVYVAVNNGKAVYDASLPAGDYNVVVTYMGDSRFNANRTSKAFTVTDHIKKNTSLISDVVIYEYRVSVSVSVDSAATGFVEFILDGNSIFAKVTDGEAVMDTILLPGEYTVKASYLGDDEFNANTTDIAFTVNEIQLKNTTIDAIVEIDENNVTINVNVDPAATGFVKFDVTGAKNYTVYTEVKDGVAIIQDILENGDYKVDITYMGDIIFNANTTSETFTVVGHVKNDTAISSIAVVDNYTVTITTSVDSAATGFVTIDVLGQTFIVPVSGGKAVFTYDFVPGTYVADVVYLGDDNFNNASTTVSFTITEEIVELKNTAVSVDVTSVENDVTITASVDSLASGLVEFNVDGKAVYIAVNNGKAVYDINLPAGDYNVVVTYMGDSRFNANKTSKVFTVTDHIKKNTSLIFDVVVYEYRVSVSVDVNPAATGFVEFTLNGNRIFAEIADGKAVMDTILLPGEYTVKATYLGDNDFNTNVTNITFTVGEIQLKNTTIDAKVDVDENNVTITVNVDSDATGFVRFDIFGSENYTVYTEVKDGVAVLEDVLGIGDYKVDVTYMGDLIFNMNATSETFTVVGHVKKDTSISAVPSVENYTVKIVIGVDENATGFVTIRILGQTFIVPVDNGNAVFRYDFVPGTYVADITYLGDDDFNGANTTATFTIIEQRIVLKNTPISVDVKSVENDVTITANINESASGLIEFNIGDKSVYIAVNNGQAVYDVVLAAGNYNVKVTYLGDDKFNSNSTNVTFSVVGHVKDNTTITAIADVDNYIVTITATINPNATGYVTLGVLNQTFIVPVYNGKAVFIFDFYPGTYNVDVTYLGDANFNEATTTTAFTVVKQVAELKNTTIDVNVGTNENNVTITAAIDSAASGLIEFNIGGKAIYIAVNNGKAIYNLVLPAGEYDVEVIYLGNDKFNANKTSQSFTVVDHIKKNTTITSDVIVDGNNVTINVNVDSDATGFVKFSLNGNNIFVEVIDGKAIVNAIVPVGNYTVIATYLGDDNFNVNATDIEIEVIAIPLKDTSVDVDIEINENNVTITATVDSDATGLVKFDVTGTKNYAVFAEVVGGKAILEDILTAGDYAVAVTYLGDLNYNSNSTSATFTVVGHVKKVTSISAVPSVDGNTVTITATVDVDATGFVTVGVLGQTFIVPVNNGKAIFTYDFAPGTYNSNIVYLGDDNFNNATTTAIFTVIKQVVQLKNTTVDVNVDTNENNATITATIDSAASGLVEFNIDGNAVYVAVNNGNAVYNIVLPAGDYNVVVTYMGDDKFNPNSTTKSFTVTDHIKKNTTLSSDVKIDEYSVIVNVGLDSTATGFVEFILNGNSIFAKVTDGNAVMDVILFPGDYTIRATYLGDDDFNANTTDITFTVKEIQLKNTTVNADVEIFENNVTVTVNVDPSATGFVRFDVEGTENYTLYIAVDEGMAVLEDVLTVGDYTVTATYLGDGNFNMNSTSESFTVVGHVKKDTQIKAVPNVDGTTVVLNVDVDKDATGFVTVGVLGQTFIVPVNGGKAVFTYDFAPGTYNSNIVYLGDDNFNNATTTASFTVIKQGVVLRNTTLDVVVGGVENDVSIIARVNESASGLVEFVIDGKAVYIAVNNGEAVYDVVLAGGDYNVSVTYLGDDKFNPNSITKSFTVSDHVKKDTQIKAVSNVEGSAVTITITVDINATGLVTVGVLGHTFIVPVNGGKAVFTYDFAPGTYNGNIVYLGDDNFNNATTTASFTVINKVVDLKNTTLDVVVGGMDNDVSIIAKVDSLASGLVEFVIDGKAVYIAVNNGEAVYDVVLPGGDYNVTVTYLGDDKFNPNSTVRSFTVVDHVKLNTSVSCDVVVNNTLVTVTAVVNETGATGFVMFNIAGREYYVPVDNGRAVLVADFAPGNYMGNVKYLGDEIFNSAVSLVYINVAEQNITLNDTTLDVVVGGMDNDVSIIAKVDSLASGLVEFVIDGKAVYIAVNNGEAVYDVVLAGGDYNVTVTYLGDDKFNSNSTTKSFTVSDHIKKDTQIKAVSYVDGSTVTIITSVDLDATGFVTVGVLGQRFIVPVNGGKAVFVYDFVPGTYVADVVYLGDNFFNNASTTASFTVINKVVDLKNTTLDVVVGGMDNDVSIIAKVDSLASGLVEFVIDGKAVYIAVNNGEAVYDVVLPGGDYNVTVTYLGDDKFNANRTSKAFTVVDYTKQNTDITSDVAVDGNNVTITVNVDSSASGFVKFTLNGKDVFAEVVGGKAVYDVVLSAGDYAAYITYIGDDKFNPNSTVETFTVAGHAKKNTTLSVVSNVRDNSVVIVVSVDSDASGNVTVYVDGVEYDLDVVKGHASITVSGLTAGEYVVVASYSGDDKYAPLTNMSTFNIPKVDINENETFVDVNLAIGSKIPRITVTLPNDATGFVVVEVNNYSYHVPVKNGISEIDLPGLAYGKYNVIITYFGDGKYNSIAKNITLNIPKPRLTAKNIGIGFTNRYPYKVRLLVDGKAVVKQYVIFKFNGKTYKRLTNSKGYATLKLPIVKPKKTYRITATYKDVSISKKVKINSILIANNIKVKKSAKSLIIKVKLKKVAKKLLKGRKLVLKLNGKKFVAKTNKKAIATFKISKNVIEKLKIGKSYKYVVVYSKDSVTKKIKVLR